MSLLSWRNYVSQDPQCNFRLTKNPLTATFIHPGLNYASFDKNLTIDLLNLMSCLIDVRFITEYTPHKEDKDELFKFHKGNKGHLFFISSYGLNITRKMYDKNVPKWPLEAKVVLGYVGSSSIAVDVELRALGHEDPLAAMTLQLISVNRHTRKPMPFPDSFKNKYKDECSMKEGFRLEPFPRPKRTFIYRREVLSLDTDLNMHTNYASYVRFSLDGLHLALRHQARADLTASSIQPNPASFSDRPLVEDDDFHGRTHQHSLFVIQGLSSQKFDMDSCGLRGITKEIVEKGLKSLKICYINECIEGDVVEVHIWQEENEAYVVRCSIEKGSQLVCQIILEYFGPLAKL